MHKYTAKLSLLLLIILEASIYDEGVLSEGVLSGRSLCLDGVMYGGGFVRGGFVRGGFVRRGFCPTFVENISSSHHHATILRLAKMCSENMTDVCNKNITDEGDGLRKTRGEITDALHT